MKIGFQFVYHLDEIKLLHRGLTTIFPQFFAQGWVINLMQPKGDIPYGVAIAILTWIGTQLHYGAFYFSGLAVATGIALYHWTLIRDRERMRCFKAFLHNNWLGAAVFAGIVGELNLRPLL